MTSQEADVFLDAEFSQTGGLIINKKITYTPTKTIEASILGRRFSDAELTSIESRMENYHLPPDTKLAIRQSTEYNDIASLKNSILSEVNKTDSILTEKDLIIQNLQSIISRNTYDTKSLLEELNVLFPSITDIEIANPQWNSTNTEWEIHLIGVYKQSGVLTEADKKKMNTWITKRMGITSISLYTQPILETYSESGSIITDSGKTLPYSGDTMEILTSY